MFTLILLVSVCLSVRMHVCACASKNTKVFASRSLMVGTDRYGSPAPTGVNAHQTTIAVADATHIAVGDYLSVGNEMMYVKSVDGNYIGALVPCPHALCATRSHSARSGENGARHRSRPSSALIPRLAQRLMGLATLLAPRVISCTVAVGGTVCEISHIRAC